MGNQSFKTLSIVDFLKITSQPDFSKLVAKEHAQVLAVQLPGTFASFSRYENSSKNRHDDVPCWDLSRVILSPLSAIYDEEDWDSSYITTTSAEIASTYIHANFVDGFEEINKFICSQGPKKNSCEDFWKMVSEHESCIIVSLTETDNEDQVCYEYWVKEEDYELAFGRYIVRTLEIIEESSFTRTRLRLTDVSSGTSREIYHFWYTHWPDYGCPTNPAEILNLISQVNKKREKMRKTADSQLGPIVVHSSAGIGRTGTFCTIDNALSQLRKEKLVSLPQTVLKIRKQRHVFLPEQYAFCYKALEHALMTEVKEIAANQLSLDATTLEPETHNSQKKRLRVLQTRKTSIF